MSATDRKDVRIVIRNVRSFTGVHSVRLAPLTILVGENSSGKSTFISMLASILSAGFPFQPSFNDRPFDLGGFSNIVTNKRVRARRIDEFSIGLTQGNKDDEDYAHMLATYVGVRDRPTFSTLSVNNRHGEVELSTNADGKLLGKAQLRGDKPEQLVLAEGLDPRFFDLNSAMVQFLTRRAVNQEADFRDTRDLVQRLFRVTNEIGFVIRPVRSVAPIRTKPRRIYDGLFDEFSPEGEHIPFRLARSLAENEHGAVAAGLKSFGRKAGLFKGVRIRRLGREPSAPFRVLASMPGGPVGLTDVGYGVSQVLPVIVECMGMPDEAVLTLQQPEVHLHPRAQAALGTFFAEFSAVRPKTTLVVETHSDFLLNRVRKEISRGTIEPRNVSLLFFEKRDAATKIHDIGLDTLGNVVNAPRSYRAFFLQEQFELMTRGEA